MTLGITTRAHKNGNANADVCADYGVQCHGEGVVHLANMYSKRHGFYIDFMTSVAKHIVEALMIHRELVRIADIKAANASDMLLHTWVFKPMVYITSLQRTRRLCFTASIKSFPKLCRQSKCFLLIEKFLESLYLCEQDETGRCITWIELYILYRISGNDKPLSPKPTTIGDKAMQVIPLDLQFRHFKNNVRLICDRPLMGGIHAKRFLPVTIKHDNLLNVGLEGSVQL